MSENLPIALPRLPGNRSWALYFQVQGFTHTRPVADGGSTLLLESIENPKAVGDSGWRWLWRALNIAGHLNYASNQLGLYVPRTVMYPQDLECHCAVVRWSQVHSSQRTPPFLSVVSKPPRRCVGYDDVTLAVATKCSQYSQPRRVRIRPAKPFVEDTPAGSAAFRWDQQVSACRHLAIGIIIGSRSGSAPSARAGSVVRSDPAQPSPKVQGVGHPIRGRKPTNSSAYFLHFHQDKYDMV